MFNPSLSTGKYFSVFKVAKVTPIYKHGNAQMVSNYRPISVLSAFSKILEKTVHKRILSFLNQNSILSELQFVSLMTVSLMRLLMRLMRSLMTVGFRGVVNDWFRNYLNNRQQKVRINDKYSDVKPISFGVSQGSTLGPFLFLIYLNDVFQDIDYETILYADDATVVIHHAKTLSDLFRAVNESLNIIHNDLLVNKLTLNISKTKYMILTPRPHRLARNPDHVISVNSISISEVHSFRFLGVTLSNNLTWKSHIESIRCKLRSCLGIIYNARDCLNTSCLLSIFHLLASTHLNYCITMWCATNFSKITKIQSLCNRILRLIFHRNPRDNIDDIYKKFAILKVRDKFKFEICRFVYTFLHRMLPDCFNSFFSLTQKFIPVKPDNQTTCTFLYLKKALANSQIKLVGVKLWNEIPNEIKQLKNLAQFKKRLKQLLLNSY